MFKRVLLAVLILIASHTTVSSLCGAQESKPPNVLFIAIDDLNDWTGTQAGHPQALTPTWTASSSVARIFPMRTVPHLSATHPVILL